MQKLLKNLLKDLIKLNVKNLKINGVKKLNNISEYEFSLVKAKLELENNNKLDLYFQFIENNKIKESIFCYWSLLYDEECKRNKTEIDSKAIITELEVKEEKSSILLEIENSNSEILKYGTIVYFINFIKYLESNNMCENIINYLENNKTTLLVGIKLNNSIKLL